MTTDEFHYALKACDFYHTATGGGCDALVRHLPDGARIILTCAEDPSVPEADEDVCIGYIADDGSQLTWTTSAQEALQFARNMAYCPSPAFLAEFI